MKMMGFAGSTHPTGYHHHSCLTWAQSGVVVSQSCSQDGGSRSALQTGELSTLRVVTGPAARRLVELSALSPQLSP